MGAWGGRSPQKKLRWGTAHASVPPIFREVVLSDARESMKRVKKGAFLVRKGSYATFNIVKKRKMWEKKGKIRKTWSMTKRVIRNGNFFRKNVIQKIIMLRPPKLGARSSPLATDAGLALPVSGSLERATWQPYYLANHLLACVSG